MNLKTGLVSAYNPIDFAAMLTAERCVEIMEHVFRDADVIQWGKVLSAKREIDDEFKYSKLRIIQSNPDMGAPGGNRLAGYYLKENQALREKLDKALSEIKRLSKDKE